MSRITLFLLAIIVSSTIGNIKQKLEYDKLNNQLVRVNKQVEDLKQSNDYYLKHLKLCEGERTFHAEEAKQHQLTVDSLSLQYDELKKAKSERVEIITKEIEKIVEKPVYQNVCFDQEGIDLINEINGVIEK